MGAVTSPIAVCDGIIGLLNDWNLSATAEYRAAPMEVSAPNVIHNAGLTRSTGRTSSSLSV